VRVLARHKTLHVTGGERSARDLGLLENCCAIGKRRFEARTERLRNGLAESGLVASVQIGRLRRLVSLLDWQRNILFAPIAWQSFGARSCNGIERWRTVSGKHVREWIGGVGDFEAYSRWRAQLRASSGCFSELAM